MTFDAPKFEILLTLKQIKKLGFGRVSHSDTSPHFTIQSAREICLVTGQGSIEKCKIRLVECVVSYYVFKAFKLVFFFEIPCWVFELMTDQEDDINLGNIVFDDNKTEMKSKSCLGHSCSRPLIDFLSRVFGILLNIFGCFWRIDFPKNCDKSTVSVIIPCIAAGYLFTLSSIFNALISTKKASFYQW